MNKILNQYLGVLFPSGVRIEPRTYNCIFCLIPLNPPVVTTSFIASNGDEVTYYYRTHKDCRQKMSEQEIKQYEDSFVDNL